MYATCLFCNAALGSNEAIEHFPVGRRLAFDAATGRLWVVCQQCARWNLSPLETRWEAIEDAERQYRQAKLRVSTDNVSLARLGDGLELIRIGAPPTLELASWRYGDQLRSRFRKFLVANSLGSAGFSIPYGMVMAAGFHTYGFDPLVMLGSTAAMMAMRSVGHVKYARWRHRTIPVTAIQDDEGRSHRLTQDNINAAMLLPDLDTNRGDETGNGWRVQFPYVSVQPASGFARLLRFSEMTHATHTAVDFSGNAALRALALILPATNGFGAHQGGVRDAVNVLAQARTMPSLLQMYSAAIEKPRTYLLRRLTPGAVAGAPPTLRLALEMSLHADDERRAMEGELHVLEQRWRDADAIAKIADDMFLPDSDASGSDPV